MPKFLSREDLALLDPDGSFRRRLERDRAALVDLARRGRTEELAVIVHKLAGAAETFGHVEVGRIATNLDGNLVAAERAGSPMPDVTPLIDALQRALARDDEVSFRSA